MRNLFNDVNETISDNIAPALDNKVDISSIGIANGVAGLDSNGLIPSSQLPSYVDDVLEYQSLSNFPATGSTGKIYVALDTNKTYRWGGSEYVEISESLALGTTSSTAYRGDLGDQLNTKVGSAVLTTTAQDVSGAVNELNSGDWVTTDRSYAQNVANNNGGKVYAFEVKASDLYYPDNVRELPSLHRLSSFQYNGENANQTRYSLSTNKDSNGRTLTKEQQEYFKDSKVVDENGNLLEVYHTTPSEFTIFKKSKIGQNTGYDNTAFGYFVTPNQNFSERFGDISNSNQYIQDLEKVYNNLSKNDLNNLFGMEYKDAVKFKNGVINELSNKYQKAYYEITNDLVNFEDIQKNQKNYNVMKLYVNATNPITHPYHAGYK